MKKLLLLSVLALSTVALVGCGSLSEFQGRDFGWKTLKDNEYIEVHYSGSTKRYVADSEIGEIKYQFIAYESVAEIYVEQNFTNGATQTDYYIGTDLTVYHYEV